MPALITLKKVSRVYQNNKKSVLGVDRLSFTVYPNEIISLIGPSGCGKTTVLKMLSDILSPTSGKILYRDREISYAREKGLVGFVPQSPTLMPNRNVERNISLPLEVKGINGRQEISDLIKLVGLEGFEKFYPHQLSGGMKQRVSIARALVYKPRVLLMDEPFASLDEIIREKLNIELVNIQRRLRQAIVFVTHNIEEAVFISNRVLIMSAMPGRIIKEDTVSLPPKRDQELKASQTFFKEVKKFRRYLQMIYA